MIIYDLFREGFIMPFLNILFTHRNAIKILKKSLTNYKIYDIIL